IPRGARRRPRQRLPDGGRDGAYRLDRDGRCPGPARPPRAVPRWRWFGARAHGGVGHHRPVPAGQPGARRGEQRCPRFRGRPAHRRFRDQSRRDREGLRIPRCRLRFRTRGDRPGTGAARRRWRPGAPGDQGQQGRPRGPRAAQVHAGGEPGRADAAAGFGVSGSGWTHFNPVRIVYARGALAQVGDHVRYQRAVLVTSSGFTRRGVVARLREALGDRLVAVLDDVRPNPDVVDIDRQAGSLATLAPDCIIALGGGSSIDTAKALARLLSQPAGTTLAAHFREGAPLASAPALPVVAIPTTSGTGAEVTPFGTVWDFAERRKYSVTGPDLFPELALLDPELTSGLPPEVTISSGLDAVSHAMESTWNHHATPVTLGLAAKSLQLSLPALPRLHDDPDDIDARGAMMQASLLAGIAISQTRTALAHSISYPLTTHFDLPHGIACSFSLPALLEFN